MNRTSIFFALGLSVLAPISALAQGGGGGGGGGAPAGGWNPPLTVPNTYVYVGNNRPGLYEITPRPGNVMSAYEKTFGVKPPASEILPDGSARYTFATNNLGNRSVPESAVWYASEIHGGRTVYVVPSSGQGYVDPRTVGHMIDTPGGGTVLSPNRHIYPIEELTVDPATGATLNRRVIPDVDPRVVARENALLELNEGAFGPRGNRATELVNDLRYTPSPSTGARLLGAANTALNVAILAQAAYSGINNTGNLLGAYLDPEGTRAAVQRGDLRAADFVPFLGGNPAYELVNGIVSPIYDDFANAQGLMGTLGALASVPGRILDGGIIQPISGLADLGISGLAHGFAAAGNAFCYLTGLCSPNLCVLGSAGCQPRGGSNGDPHIISYDGYRYDMQGVGEFVATTNGSDFIVQARTRPWLSSTTVSTNVAVAMQVGSNRVTYDIDETPPWHVDGVPTSIGSGLDLSGGGRIEVADRVFDVYWPTGERVHISLGFRHLNYSVAPVQTQVGRLAGLLGNLDGDPRNDFAMRDGTVLASPLSFIDLYNVFAAEWRVRPEESLFDYAPGESTETFTDLDFPRQPVSSGDLSAADRDAARAQCLAAGVTDPEVLDGCILDVGVTGEQTFAETSAGVPPAEQTLVNSCPVVQSVVSYGDGGFRYLVGSELPIGWDQPDFDDSSWDRAVGRLGNASCGAAGPDTWPNGTDALVRLRFDLVDACGLELGFLLDGQILEARLNGNPLLSRTYFHESCARPDSLVLHPPLNTWRTGANVLAVRLRSAPGGFSSYDQRVNLGSFAPDVGVACGTTDNTCDGVDDDCDGLVDDGYSSTQVTCGRGACQVTTMTSCEFGRIIAECTPGAPGPTDALCDGVDENCNGTADEEYVSVQTTCGTGMCATTGATSCVNGAVVDSCTPGTLGGTDTTCDGLDDDCDGVADDGYVSVATTCGAGICARSGATSCVNGAVVDSCVPGAPAASDVSCDGFDDDCNGLVDDGYASRVTTCGAGTCARTGRTSCQGGVERDSCVPGTPAAGNVCSPEGARPGLFGRVYNGFSVFTGAIVQTRVDAFLNLGEARDWAFRSGTLTTNFSVQWSGNIVVPVGGSYVFGTASDDGSAVRIDGATVVSNNLGNSQLATFRSGTVNLTSGVHRIEVLWGQAGGSGGIELYWQVPGQAMALVPRDVLSHNPTDCFEPAPFNDVYCGSCGTSCGAGQICSPTGCVPETDRLDGLYRTLRAGFATYTGAVDQTRIDPEVSFGARFGWGWRPNNRVTNFSATWDGYVTVPSTGNWRFGTTSDDGSAIHIDGDWVANNNLNNTQLATFREGGVWLAAGTHRLKVFYTQSSGSAGIELYWKAPGSSNAVLVPRTALTHVRSDCVVAPPLDPDNCGACNRACAEGDICDETGACVSERAAGLSRALYSGFATYTGTPVQTRIDPELSFGAREQWGWSPRGLTTNFSAVWNGYLLAPETGQYYLGSTSSDGSGVFVDTDWVLNNNLNNTQLPTYREQAVWLEAGPHRISVMFTQGSGDSGIELYWRREGESPSTIPPANLFHMQRDCTRAGELDPLSCGACGVVCAAGMACTPAGTCSDDRVPGLYRKLYPAFATYTGTPVATEIDLELSYGAARNWAWTPSKLENNWSAVWDGYVDAPVDGLYTIGTTSSDGSGVFIDTDLVVNNNLSNAQLATYRQRTTYLRAGPHRIQVLYTNGSGARGIELGWSTPLGVTEIIPASRLWHLPDDCTTPAPNDLQSCGGCGTTCPAGSALCWDNACRAPIAGGLTGTYYAGFAVYGGTPLGTQLDPQLAFGDATAWSYRPFGRATNVSAIWTGYLSIPADGTYELGTTSKDGSGFWLPTAGVFLNNNLNNAQLATYRSTTAFLRAGLYPLEVRWTHGSGQSGIDLQWRPPGAPAITLVPASNLFHD